MEYFDYMSMLMKVTLLLFQIFVNINQNLNNVLTQIKIDQQEQ